MNRREFIQALAGAAGGAAVAGSALRVDAVCEGAVSPHILPVTPPPPEYRTPQEKTTGACLYAGSMGIFRVVGWITEMEFLYEQCMIYSGMCMGGGQDRAFVPARKNQSIQLKMLSPDMEMINAMMCSAEEVDYRIVFNSESLFSAAQRIDFSGHLTNSEYNHSMDGPVMTNLEIQVLGLASWS